MCGPRLQRHLLRIGCCLHSRCVLPANPAFYTRPETVEAVVDTVVARVLDHIGVQHRLVARWGEEGL